MRYISLAIMAAMIALVALALTKTLEPPQTKQSKTKIIPTKTTGASNMKVAMKTTLGTIILELYPDKAPETVANFVQYVRDGHYNATIFHRVIPGFMIQGGGFAPGMQQKPTRAPIKNEADNGLKNEIGTVAMARTPDPDSASAQFFINVANNNFLNYSAPTPQGYGYCVFGKVIDGMDTVKAIEKVKTSTQGMHQDVPVADIVIENAHIVEPEETGDKEDKG